MREPRELTLTDLLDVEVLQRLQDAFARATGVASIITDPRGKPLTRPSNFSRFCRDVVRGTAPGLRNCMRSDAVVGRKNPDGPLMQRCLSAGLWDGGASICVGDQHLANWLIGQVLNEETPESELMAYAREIGADEGVFAEALREVPRMSKAQFSHVCDALFLIANRISDLAYRNLALQEGEARLRTTLDSIGDAVIATDLEGAVTMMNPHAEALTGWLGEEAQGRTLREVFRALRGMDRTAIPDLLEAVQAGGGRATLEPGVVLVDRWGGERPIADSASLIRGAGGQAEGMVLVFRDISHQLRLEEELRQSQKMEAIGQLAGGVAHDFNNLLQGILGAADLLHQTLGEHPALSPLVKTIADSAGRAAGLTRKLLDFSRRGQTFSSPVDVHRVIRDALQILERSIDRKVTIRAEFKAANPTVVGDPSQIENAVINLGINARDAMPEGGILRVETADHWLTSDDELVVARGLAPGAYLEITVSDTGHGIPPEVVGRIFEPFFTTKELGKGTGLGLASVYGTVQNHRGAIRVESEPGAGTRFHILLPTVPDREESAPRETPRAAAAVGGILVVEDESVIRATVEAMLSRLGYRVILAQDGEEGLDLFRRHREAIDIVLLDVVMPKMGGPEVLRAIREEGSQVPVLLSSGFARSGGISALIHEHEGVGFIQKPYRLSQLAERLAKARMGDMGPRE